MRADSFAGQVLAVLSRRSPAFTLPDAEPRTFPGRALALLHRTPGAAPSSSGKSDPPRRWAVFTERETIEFPGGTSAGPVHHRQRRAYRATALMVVAIVATAVILAVYYPYGQYRHVPAEPPYWLGLQITVPDLTGMSPAAAQAALTSKGLVPAPSPDEVTNQPNVVHSQSPAAATAVASGTQVQYVYEDAAPVPLYLHKRAGDPFYLLSTEASVAGYSNQRSLGNVFPASSPGGGTTAVYRYRCDNVCGSGTTYYFSMSKVASFNPGWVNDGVAFYAYAQPPAGASSIAAMFSPGDSSWVWAVDPSSEHDIYAGRGYTSGNNFTLGYVWP